MALTKVKLIADGVITSANLDASHGITTSDIGEGSNLYYTDSRVSSYLSTNGFATQTDIVAAITDSAPVTLDTLNELAAALGDDPNFATTTATSLGLKAPLASPSFTGNATFAGSITLSQNGTNFEHGYAGNGLVLSHYNVGPSNAIVSGGASNPDVLFINNGGSASDWSNVSITGNVGINETNPASDLVVRADSAGGRGGEITILNYASNAIGNEAALNFGLENSTYAGDAGNAQIKAIITNSSAGTDLVFTNWSGSAFNENMRIDSSGLARFTVDSGTASAIDIGYISSARTIRAVETGGGNARPLTLLAQNFTFKDDFGTRMIIDSSGNIMMGKDSQSGNAALTVKSTAGGNTGLILIEGDTTNDGHGLYVTTDNKFVITRFTNGSYSDNFVMDSSGKIGVSNTNPSAFNSLGATAQIVIGTSSNFVSNLTTFSSTTGYGSISFADSDSSSSSSQYSGLIQYYHTDNSMTLYTSAQPRMRIDGSGDVGIGTIFPSTRLHVSGSFDPDDALGYVHIENTNTTSGSQVTNSALTVKNYHGTSQFMQWEENGLRIGSRILTNSGVGDVVFTAGADSEKMRLLAGGGLTFNGDTAAANALDDYEEGTWTPDVHGSTTRGTVSYQYRSGSYTKIGNRVWCRFGFKLSSISGATGRVRVDGLPFTSRTYGAYQEPNFSVSTGLLATTANAYRARMFVVNGSSYLEGRISVNTDTIWNISDFGGDEWIILAFHYETHI